MKKIRFITISAMICIIAISSSISADTIIDSVYASGVGLSGSLFFRQSLQQVVLYLWGIQAGDTGESLIESDPNSIFRGYVSFTLPEIPEGYMLDSAFIRLHQEWSVGDGTVFGQEPYPLFHGVELPCIMDHIDYGDELDVSDWTKGDPGDPGTLHTNIGIISDSAEVGYRYLDITPYVLDDYNNSRDKTQYRIRFPIDTDWDDRYDGLAFSTTGSGSVTAPMIVLYFFSNNSIDAEVVPELNSFSVYPNPFANSIRFSFSAPYGHQEDRRLKIYNLRGQLVKELEFGTENEIQWDGKDENDNVVSNGLYLIRIESKDVNVIKKVIKLN